MANFNEEAASAYDWETGGIYVIEETDPVEGGPDGVSNRQSRELAVRTRNLHERLEDLKQETTNSAADLAEAIDTKTEAALRGAKEYTDTREVLILVAADVKDAATLTNAKAYADGVSATGSEAALRSAKDYTDTRETSILAAADVKDAATLRSSKDYTDTSINALVDGAPETMDTIREVADELKKHADTATAMMQVIGEKATKDEVNAALTKKQNTTTDPGAGYDLNNLHTTGTYNVINAQNAPVAGWIYVDVIKFTAGAGWVSQFVYTLGASNTPNRIFHRNGINTSEWTPWVEIWHAGNFDPASYNHGIAIPDNQKLNGGFLAVGAGSPFQFTHAYTMHCYGAGVMQIAMEIFTGNIATRCTQSENSGEWLPWKYLYHSGNLGPATDAVNGLMSAEDKAKLDGISEGGMKLLGAGVVSGGGIIMKKKGVVTNASQAGGTGYYRVFHTIGHTNYEVQATAKLTGNINGGHVSVVSRTTNYFEVWTADDASANDLSFFFQIYEF